MRSAASSYAAMHMVAGSRPVFVIAWEWHIGLALLCGCSGALEYPTTNFYRPINKSLSLSLSLILILMVWIAPIFTIAIMKSCSICSDFKQNQKWITPMYSVCSFADYGVLSWLWVADKMLWTRGLAKKNTSEHNERVCFFAKTSTRVHKIFSFKNYHHVIHFSHKNFFPPNAYISIHFVCSDQTQACASRISIHVELKRLCTKPQLKNKHITKYGQLLSCTWHIWTSHQHKEIWSDVSTTSLQRLARLLQWTNHHYEAIGWNPEGSGPVQLLHHHPVQICTVWCWSWNIYQIYYQQVSITHLEQWVENWVTDPQLSWWIEKSMMPTGVDLWAHEHRH